MTDKANGKPRRPRRSREDIPQATAEHVDAGLKFLEGVVERMGLDLDVDGKIDGKRARFELDGKDKDAMVGGLGQGNGAVPMALETLVSMSLGRLEGGRPSVALDVAGVARMTREERERASSRDNTRSSSREGSNSREGGSSRERSSGDREADRGPKRSDRDRDRRPERPREPKRSAKEKAAREEQLDGVGAFLGERIAAIGVPVVIMGMDSFDRRVIHQSLGDQGGMKTESEGFGSFRRLKITAK